jgi:hypothetical protein
MDFLPKVFLRQQSFTGFDSFKRVTKEGSGDLPISNTLIKYEQKVFRAEDFSQTEKNQSQVFRAHEGLFKPEAGISALFSVILTMRVGEEAWTLIPAGFHQEKDEIWEDLIYFLRIVEFEKIETIPPGDQKFLSETRIGPEGVLLKRVLSEGTGQVTPFNYLVTYYYSVFKENGSEFESYTAKSHILPRVPLQDTHSAIYHALITMKEGEDCLVFAPPGFFKYRNKENLWVSIQLLYISEPKNCCYPSSFEFLEEMEIGEGILKRILKQGVGEVVINANKYWLEYEGWLDDSYQFQKFKEECVNFSKENKNHALWTVKLLKTMRKGEQALIRCPPGTHLYDDSLEKETLWIKVTLKEYLEFYEEPTKIKDLSERLETCKKIKEIANRLFRSGIRTDCKTLYNRINSSLVFKAGFIETLEIGLKEKILELRSLVSNNLALVHLKDAEEGKDKDKTCFEKNIAKVFELTNNDLQIHPKNTKALFRRSKAFLLSEEYGKAIEDVNQALSIEPRNKECIELMREIKEHSRVHDNKQKNIFREVFKEENWNRESEKDEERSKRIQEENERAYEEQQEQEINKWINELQTHGVRLNGDEALNLLMNDESEFNEE